MAAQPPQQDATVSVAWSLAVDLTTERAFEALRSAGVRTMLLKGPAIARWLYDDPGLRGYADVDLLVERRHEEEAMRALGGLGFRDRLASSTERDASPHARELRAPLGPASGMRTAAGRGQPEIEIDLHTSFHGVHAPAEEFWRELNSGAEAIPISGTPVPVPGEPARAMIVGLHAAAAKPGNERPLADLDRALERLDDDLWREAYALARRLDATPAFLAGLSMRPAGRELGERLGFEGEPDETIRLRAAGPPVAGGLERLSRTPGAGAKLRLVAREVFPTSEFMPLWSPLARRGRVGLALAYAYRPLWLLARLPAAAAALRRARREAELRRRATPGPAGRGTRARR